MTKLVWSIPWQHHLSLIKEIRPRPDFRSQTIFPNFSIIIFEFVAYSALLCNDHITTALFDIFGPANHIHCIYSIYSERTSFRQKFLTILYYVMFRRLVKKKEFCTENIGVTSKCEKFSQKLKLANQSNSILARMKYSMGERGGGLILGNLKPC